MKKIALLLGLTATLFFALAANLPRKSPNLVVHLPGGKQAKLSDYAGDVVCVTFILSTCPHCQKTTQVLSSIEKDLGPKGFRVLSGIINEDANIPDFIQRFQPAFPVGAVDRFTAASYLQLDGSQRMSMPLLAIIDRNGMIEAQYSGGDDILKDEATQEQKLRAEFLKLLNEQKSARTK